MKKAIPVWAMQRAGPEVQGVVRDSHSQGTMHIKWPDLKALRGWAKQQSWPTPRLGFEEAFLTTLLENDVNFELERCPYGITAYPQ